MKELRGNRVQLQTDIQVGGSLGLPTMLEVYLLVWRILFETLIASMA